MEQKSEPRLLRVARRVRENLRVRREFQRDRRRYMSLSSPEDGRAVDPKSWKNRTFETQITKDYHRVEKGLALAVPKRPFGAEVSGRLEVLLAAAEKRGVSGGFMAYGREALTALHEWNESGVVSDELAPRVNDRVHRQAASETDRSVPFSDLVRNRRSVRDFAEGEVPGILLERAVDMAINTPSVCNRQPWIVHAIQNRRDVSEVLKHQNGNAGFRSAVPAVLVVTVDARLFAGAGERNQSWIEGGLFSMSLAYALEDLGLNTCMLNMSRMHHEFDGLRDLLGLAIHENVVMMIAVGQGTEGRRVARSPRRTSQDVLRRHRPFAE